MKKEQFFALISHTDFCNMLRFGFVAEHISQIVIEVICLCIQFCMTIPALNDFRKIVQGFNRLINFMMAGEATEVVPRSNLMVADFLFHELLDGILQDVAVLFCRLCRYDNPL